ncbi:ABC transporter ATP-binding protein [Halorubellus sp. PRR65]|uniref:ABC transporter ATP-binding protein n=1 Tax=Halorubellus sp. PRR65 TaxID=3098148 RepID=UPI002B25B687|nr:ABC transporter ATP-binding protein [Halorubellus sp. PRR65]
MSAALSVDSLRKRYGDTVVVEGVDFTVDAGDAFGLLGPNGAGKSTIIDLVLGLATPTTGTVRVFGTDVRAAPRSVREHLGVLPERFDFYDGLTGRENLAAFLRLEDATEDPAALLSQVELDPDAFDRTVATYSKGMRQRLGLATALAGDPDLLILDEPTSGLDPSGISLVRDLIADRTAAGTTVFFSSHRLTQVQAVCDRVGVLHDGRFEAVGDVDALLGRLDSPERLHVSTERPPDPAVLERLRDTAGVAAVEVDDRTVSVDCRESTAKADVVERLNRTCGVRDFGVDERTLQHVFDDVLGEDAAADGNRHVRLEEA